MHALLSAGLNGETTAVVTEDVLVEYQDGDLPRVVFRQVTGSALPSEVSSSRSAVPLAELLGVSRGSRPEPIMARPKCPITLALSKTAGM